MDVVETKKTGVFNNTPAKHKLKLNNQQNYLQILNPMERSILLSNEYSREIYRLCLFQIYTSPADG